MVHWGQLDQNCAHRLYRKKDATTYMKDIVTMCMKDSRIVLERAEDQQCVQGTWTIYGSGMDSIKSQNIFLTLTFFLCDPSFFFIQFQVVREIYVVGGLLRLLVSMVRVNPVVIIL
jgi:hypothetical protein